MITDIIKSGEYREYKIVTFIKDYMIVTIVESFLVVAGIITASFVMMSSLYDVVYSSDLFWILIRVMLVINLIACLYVNDKSHSKEIMKK